MRHFEVVPTKENLEAYWGGVKRRKEAQKKITGGRRIMEAVLGNAWFINT